MQLLVMHCTCRGSTYHACGLQELADRLAKFNASVQFSIGYNANNTKAWVSVWAE